MYIGPKTVIDYENKTCGIVSSLDDYIDYHNQNNL